MQEFTHPEIDRKSKLSISGTSLCHTSWQHPELGSHCHPCVGRDAPEAKQVFGLQRQTGQDRTSPWTSQQVNGESGLLFIMGVPASLTAFGTGRGILPGTSAWMVLFLKVLGGRVKINVYFLEEGAYAKCSTF